MPPLSTNVRDPSEDITEDRDGGIRKIVVNKGTGLKPFPGDKVNIRYVVFLENGNHYTSNSHSENENFSFTIGKREVVKAWEQALPTMQKGEKCILHCHYSYAYGSTGLPPLIRPNTNCLFEIELISFQGQDLSKKKDEGVLKSVIEQGDSISDDFPYDYAKCTISYKCYIHPPNDINETDIYTHTQAYTNSDDNIQQQILNETMSNLGYRLVEIKDDVKVILGDLDELTKGLNRAVKKMRVGERARLVVSSKYGYGSKGCERLGVPGDCELLYVVCLHDFVNVKQHWEMSRQELLQEAVAEKERATDHFKNSKHYQARKRYSRALLLVESVNFLKAERTAVCDGEDAARHEDDMRIEDNRGGDDGREEGININNCNHVDKDDNKDDDKDDDEDDDKDDVKDVDIYADKDSDNNDENITSLESNSHLTTPKITTKMLSTLVPITPTITQQQTTTQNQITTQYQITTTKPPESQTSPTTIKDKEMLKDMMAQKDALQVIILLNISVCHLKLNNFLRAFDAADRVLSLQPNNLKALYRRGMAHYHMANLHEARDDFKRLLSIQPRNNAALRQCRLCDKAIDGARKKEKDVFEGMFQKFAFFDLQKGWEEGRAGRRDVFSEIGEWENGMAEGMMTLEQEMAAFGESMPPPCEETDEVIVPSDED